jgi:serine/threonine protein kinase
VQILLSAAGRAKLADFDAALPEGTQVQLVRGTPECHPPEYLLEGKSMFTVKRKADTWALGLVLYEVLIGAYPWDYASIIDPDYMAFKTSRSSTAPWNTLPRGLLNMLGMLFTDDVSSRANAGDVLAYVRSDLAADAAQLRGATIHDRGDRDDGGDFNAVVSSSSVGGGGSSSTDGGIGSGIGVYGGVSIGGGGGASVSGAKSDAGASLSGRRSSASDMGIKALTTAAWRAPLNTSENWVRSFHFRDCFCISCR